MKTSALHLTLLILLSSILAGTAQVEQSSSDKVEAELQERKQAMRALLKENLKTPKPGFRIYEGEAYLSNLQHIKSDGPLEVLSPDTFFTMAFIEAYPHSSTNTHQWDGHQIVLYEWPSDTLYTGKVIYQRREGGHLSDQLLLVLINDGEQRVTYLPLASSFGKDGYQATIESELIAPNRIKRTLIETLGWTMPDDKAGAQLPRSKTVQVYEIREGGALALLRETVENFNFEVYLEE